MHTDLTISEDPAAWNATTCALPGHGIYQAWSWGEWQSARGVMVRRYSALRSGQPVAAASVELRRLRQLPWSTAYIPAGPLWQTVADLGAFLALLLPELRAQGALSLRLSPLRPPSEDPFPTLVSTRVAERPALPRLTWRVDLRPGRDTVFTQMMPNTRRRVRQAARQGVEIKEASLGDLHHLYEWLAATAQRRALQLLSAADLRSMLATWQRHGDGAYYLAWHEGHPCAGVICSYFGDEALGHFIGDDQRHRTGPSVVQALYWHCIDEAIRHGCSFIDFGSIGPADDDPLRSFKRQFGGFACAYQPERVLRLRPVLHTALTLLSGGRLNQRL